jgi:hypothetical protein
MKAPGARLDYLGKLILRDKADELRMQGSAAPWFYVIYYDIYIDRLH